MAKCSYRIIPRKDGHTCDVEMTEPGCEPRIINTFNREPDAWEWLTEQQHVEKILRGLKRNTTGST